ncbi:TPA: two-component-system connector protein YcgZ [Klebsiella pneumoniae]|nr:two-component-system connector protein YcgZ [Klebsiella pneumoniae]
MQQNGYIPDTANAIAQYFNKASLPSQQETLGQIVMDILNEGRHLNRKALCTKLLSRLDRARAPEEPEEESHYQTLIGLLFAGQE